MVQRRVRIPKSAAESFLGLYALLQSQQGPIFGVQLADRIFERTNHRWRPRPGSIYPALRRLEERGWVRSSVIGRTRVYSITAAGKRALAVVVRQFDQFKHGPPDPSMPLNRDFVPSGHLEDFIIWETRWLLRVIREELHSPRSVLDDRGKRSLVRRLRTELDYALSDTDDGH